MKHLTLILLLLLSISAKAQQNLVPNPSFEDTLFCPYQYNQIDAATDWINFGNTPDYFNSCSFGNLNVPNNNMGYQNAHLGNAMAGLITYINPNSTVGPNYREYIGIPLITNLIVGEKYYISFYCNLANKLNICFATSKIGIRFSTVSYTQMNCPALNNYANLYSDSIIKDTVNWVKISNSFIADSNYTFLSIGNFFDDINTDTMNLSNFFSYSYYYIDDICVSTDSLICNTILPVPINEPELVIISPNPNNGIFYIENLKFIDYIKIYDLNGKLVFENPNNSENVVINLGNKNAGLYLMLLFYKGHLVAKNKFLLTY